MCADGYDAVLSPGSGALLRCIARSLNQCKAVAHAIVNIVGNGCACEAGCDPSYSSSDTLQACISQGPIQDSATAVSGTWTTIPVLANDARNASHIMNVSTPVNGGQAVVVAHTSGAEAIKYLSKDGFIGQDVFNYTTAEGTANVTVDVTPGSCAGSKCGALGSCNAGRCSCAADSGMMPVFVVNSNTTARAATPKVPACRYPGA
jgi:hypothetical protein